MNVGDIKNEVMFQTNNDVDDLGDFVPYIMDYINDGYDRLVYAYADTHCGEEYPYLRMDTDIPQLPEWTHRALADWATWLVYRNGNPQKQNRGFQFRTAFDEILLKITQQGGKDGRPTNFFNIPE
jgi:hypothetical protein